MHKNHLSLKETAYHFNLGNLDVVKNGNVYIMRKDHKLFMKNDVVEILNQQKRKKNKSEDNNEDLIAEIET